VVANNLLPLISAHDRGRFDVRLYGLVARPDRLTGMFKTAADGWTDMRGMDDGAIADRIAGDGVDILVVLAGRFDDNRPFVAAHRAAPIQISFHDVATSGLDAMDALLTDAILSPPESAAQFTERLVRLPVYYQFLPPDNLPELAPLPAAAAGRITFGSFNKPEKITPDVAALWARVLDAVPGSRLALKFKNLYGDPETQRFWRARFERHGVGPDRLILLSGDDRRRDHLALYGQIDIALDPFPFNGATTTFEAMAMGVPVVTLAGTRFAGRVAASILHHASCADLIAADADGYVAIARGLAGDLERLADLRAGLRNRLTASPLCDGTAYARTVEDAYRALWRDWPTSLQ
jgi:predicted O-linked N-acetylglucosamine transferase (SPINDLY family)